MPQGAARVASRGGPCPARKALRLPPARSLDPLEQEDPLVRPLRQDRLEAVRKP